MATGGVGDEDLDLDGHSSAELLATRKAFKFQLTKLIGKIDRLIASRGSRTTLSNLKEDLDELNQRCLVTHLAFVSHSETKAQQIKASEKWRTDLEEQVAGVHARLEDYMTSRAGDAPSVVSKGSSVHSTRSLETRKALLEAQIKERAIRKEGEVKAAYEAKLLEIERSMAELKLQEREVKGRLETELRAESAAVEVQLASLEHQVASQADETLEHRLTEFQSEEEMDVAGTGVDTLPPAVEIEESVNRGAGRTEDRHVRRDITVPPLSQLAQRWWTTGTVDTRGTTSGGARPRVSFQEPQLSGGMRIARHPVANSNDGPATTPPASSGTPRRSDLFFDPTVPPPMNSTFTLASLNRRAVANDASTPRVEAAEAPSFRESTVERWSHAPARLSRQNVVNRLPKLKLEPYNGDPREWTLWIETFRVTVHDIVQDDALRLAYLRESLSPEVRKSVQMLLYRPELYHQALLQLERMYGHLMVVARAHLRGLLSLPVLKEGDIVGLREFASHLQGVVSDLQLEVNNPDLYSPATQMQVVEKLPPRLRTDWGKDVLAQYPLRPSLVQLSSFLTDRLLAESVVRDVFVSDFPSKVDQAKPKAGPRDQVKPKAKPSPARSANVFATGAGEEALGSRGCSVCGREGHSLDNCEGFKSLPADKRFKVVCKERRCFRCHAPGHLSHSCKVVRECGVGECKAKHHPLLHGAPQGRGTTANPTKSSVASSSVGTVAEVNVPHVGTASVPHRYSVLLSVVPVAISNGRTTTNTWAILDSGSEVTLIRNDVAEQLQLDGPEASLTLKTFHGSDPRLKVKSVSFTLSQVGPKGQAVDIGVRGALSVPILNVSNKKVNWPEAKLKWKHLADLDLSPVDTGQVTMLIGLDVPEAHEVLDSRVPPRGTDGPRAIRTHFGWCVVGRIPPVCELQAPQINRIAIADDDLSMQLQRFWSTESFGTKPDVKLPPSREEVEVLNALESSSVLKNGHWEIGLLWKDPAIALPDNRVAAMHRLLGQERRFKKDPVLAERYATAIEEYISLGHARRLTSEELVGRPGRTWYLPHHAVCNPNKPAKVRVVFDASAKYRGVSLNDCLASGPSLISCLTDVLLKFRQRAVAVTGDIVKMFHQVRVPVKDQDALRFLWRSPGTTEDPGTYRMQVQIFGATSSPTICNYALQRTARENKDSEDVSRRVFTNFYVDNYLDSFDEEETAMRVTKALKELLERGGFELGQWISSSQKVVRSLQLSGINDALYDLDVQGMSNSPTMERTLGVLWDWKVDEICFKFSVPSRVETKRTILSVISRVFDPLGLISPIVLSAKAMLQDLWRAQLDWDDELPNQLQERWQYWLADLQALGQIRLPRCLTSKESNPVNHQLHVFTDASDIGFGAVICLRTRYSNQSVSVVLVTAKSRVAPVKQLTIPRLELQGAVLGARLLRSVTCVLDLPVSSVHCWTDSTTVLSWLRSSRAKFKTFVAARVGEILDLTRAEQWQHVPSEENPADICSRGATTTLLLKNRSWFRGPEFLQDPDEYFSVPVSKAIDEPSDEEVIPSGFVGHVASHPNAVSSLIQRKSSFVGLLRVVAWMRRFGQNSKVAPEERLLGELTGPEIVSAEERCCKVVQEEVFEEELAALRHGDALPGTSRLVSLAPFVDAVGLLRVGGRLSEGDLLGNLKHPVILPGNLHFTRVLIRDQHLKLFHASTTRILSQVVQKYWILSARRAVREVVRGCFYCRRREASPRIPIMAPLPKHRLQAYQHPFTCTGIDYFGPFEVIIHRRVHKRYVCLFTCMTTRAVHLELTHSLSADSFVLAFRRFCSRRGCPKVCYSDNGTNLTAGEREMREALEAVDQDAVQRATSQDGIEWHFNPPSAPHFGGVWERLIQSAKRALRVVLNNRTVSEEVLATLIIEVEALLNGRPLTHVSLDPGDLEPLTPNHFLLGRSSSASPPVNEEVSLPSKRQWRATQSLVDHYWRRWMTEYIPYLQERRKWNRAEPDLQVDDVVLIADPNSPRGTWPVGRVTQIFPGRDGVARTAEVRTGFGAYVRPIARLCRFDTHQKEEGGS